MTLTAERHGWLDLTTPLADDATLAAAIDGLKRPASTISSAEPYREPVERRVDAGVSGIVIYAALVREHGYRGSYSSVHRLLAAFGRTRPPEATERLAFAPGEAAQFDFGAGAIVLDPARNQSPR